jgi:hypothetical protein
MKLLSAALAVGLLAAPLHAQSDLYTPLDRVLDTYVRDGLVYYRALKTERTTLDRFIGSLDVPADRVTGWGREAQIAFWVNAYNALVLRTVINAYPISGKSPDYPPASVRQVPGGFDVVRHPVGGRLVSLDEIETDVIAGFDDARIFLLLGRGALGSARLRSEAIRAERLETQLAEAVKECASRSVCVALDQSRDSLVVTPLVGWRSDQFVATFGPQAGPRWAERSPIERAVAAMVHPHLFDGEQQYLEKNTFRMTYGDFDWRLNDLTGRGTGLFSTVSRVREPGLPPERRRPGTRTGETVENRPVPRR